MALDFHFIIFCSPSLTNAHWRFPIVDNFFNKTQLHIWLDIQHAVSGKKAGYPVVGGSVKNLDH